MILKLLHQTFMLGVPTDKMKTYGENISVQFLHKLFRWCRNISNLGFSGILKIVNSAVQLLSGFQVVILLIDFLQRMFASFLTRYDGRNGLVRSARPTCPYISVEFWHWFWQTFGHDDSAIVTQSLTIKIPTITCIGDGHVWVIM